MVEESVLLLYVNEEMRVWCNKLNGALQNPSWAGDFDKKKNVHFHIAQGVGALSPHTGNRWLVTIARFLGPT